MEKIFENYEVFYNMIMSTTLLSNSHNEVYAHDAGKIIDFYAEAYGLNNDLAKNMKQVILFDLINFGLNSDKEVEKQNRAFDRNYDINDKINEVKCNVLDEIEVLCKRYEYFQKINYFDYSFYHIYDPRVRYYELNASAKLGVVSIVRLLGIMNVLGIGCDKDYDKAIIRFTQCAYWGDIPSMYLLKHIYFKTGKKKEMKTIEDLIILSKKYLNMGITVLPEKLDECKEAQELYVYISSILQDVVINLNKVDIVFSFVEAMLLDNLSYEDKLDLINNYTAEKWKALTNAINITNNRVGF